MTAIGRKKTDESKRCREMQEDFKRITQRLLADFIDLQKCVEKQIEDGLKGALDPALLQRFLKSAGFDASALSGMMGKTHGFDPYAVLDLDKSATDGEIKKRFRERLRQHHPDTAGGAGSKFYLQQVLVAFQLIGRERGWQ